MIISSEAKIHALLSELSSARLTSLLPLEVQVLKKLSAESFLLQINGKQLEVTTDRPLQPGETYLASVSRQKNSTALLLSHFHKAPVKPEQTLYSVEELIAHFKKPSKESITELHTGLLSKLAISASKEEFNFLTQILLGLCQDIVSLPFNYKGGFGLLQYKRRKKQEKQSQDEVQFYAHLKHLGPLDGTLSLIDDDVHIRINVLFEETMRLLEELKPGFSFHQNVQIRLQEEISPLFLLNDKILDIRL